MKNFKFILVALMALFISATVVANEKPQYLKLPSVVGSNMVLQHSSVVNVWGWAKPKAKVTVAADWVEGKPIKVKADAEGFWMTQLTTLGAGYTAHKITIKSGKEIKELTNILFGEVWLCSGQSNMEWAVRRAPDVKAETNNNIRLYCTGRTYAMTPQNEVPAQRRHKAQWSVCNAKSAHNFSAIGYAFGRELQEKLNVPIGLIDASYGGTPIEGWLSAEYLTNNPKLANITKKSRNKRWKSKISSLHNANIYPIRHTTIAGVIWYQGCSNVSYGGYYHMLNGLIRSWREEFRSPEMPFYIVQIAPHTYSGIRGAIVRDAQALVAARTANCELVVTNDQNQIPGDIHPPKKMDVAHRLAQCALGGHYRKINTEFRSPAYRSMEVEGSKIRVHFKNVPSILVMRGEGRVNGFQIGVKDPENPKKIIFSLAEAVIEGKSIVVSAEGVENPIAVRYCFNEDVGNVFSEAGLPLAPFRTDRSNASLSARPYIAKATDTPIKFEGKGWVKRNYADGDQVWKNLPYQMSNQVIKEFAGYEFCSCEKAEKGGFSKGGRIVAQADGKAYILTTNSAAIRKQGWRLIIPTIFRMKNPETGKYWGSLYIAERDVKAGEVIELPRVKKYEYSALPLAKSIEYVEVE